MPETPQRELAFIPHPFERFWVVEFFLTGHVLPFQRVPLTTTVIADPNTIKSISSLPALTHVSSPPAGGELSSVKTLMNVSSPLSCGELSLIKKKTFAKASSPPSGGSCQFSSFVINKNRTSCWTSKNHRTRLLAPVCLQAACIQRCSADFGAGQRIACSPSRSANTACLANSESGFYSWYFLIPKKDAGLRPILDLRRMNQGPHTTAVQNVNWSSCKYGPRTGFCLWIWKTLTFIAASLSREWPISTRSFSLDCPRLRALLQSA